MRVVRGRQEGEKEEREEERRSPSRRRDTTPPRTGDARFETTRRTRAQQKEKKKKKRFWSENVCSSTNGIEANECTQPTPSETGRQKERSWKGAHAAAFALFGFCAVLGVSRR